MTGKTAMGKLTARRTELTGRLRELQARHTAVVGELAGIEAEWTAALAAGSDTAVIVERRRVGEADLAELDRAIAQVSAWAEEAERAVQRGQESQQLDTDLTAHSAALEAYGEDLAALDGAHARAVDRVIAAAVELHGVLNGVRRANAELTSAADSLVARGALLGREESPGTPGDWQAPLEPALRDTELWPLWLTSIQPAGSQRPSNLLAALAEAARKRMLARDDNAAALASWQGRVRERTVSR